MTLFLWGVGAFVVVWILEGGERVFIIGRAELVLIAFGLIATITSVVRWLVG